MKSRKPQSLAVQLDFLESLLRTSLKVKDPLATKCIHGRIIKTGLHLAVLLANNLVNAYGKTGFIADAKNVFDEMPLRYTNSWNTLLSAYAKNGMIKEARRLFEEEIPHPDSVSWTSLIVGYNKKGQLAMGIRMFFRMIACRIWPTEYTFTTILSACALNGALDIGRKIHSIAVKFGLSKYVSVANSLLNMYTKSGDVATAKMVFDTMKVKDISSWNSLLSLHIEDGQIDLARIEFEGMNEHDIVSWNLMIVGCSQHRYDVEAIRFFSRMLTETGLRPDQFTLGSVLSSCANLKELNIGKQIHAHIIRTEFDSSEAVNNALISMYCKCTCNVVAERVLKQIGSSTLNVIGFTALLDGYAKLGDIYPARLIFDSLKERDVVLWTAMIVGYSQNGLYHDAMGLFRLMVKKGPRPNHYTFAAMLSVASSFGSLNQGKQIHSTAIRLWETSSSSVSNALITMYAKAGNIHYAKIVFNQRKLKKEKISWTSMILALAQHGLVHEAIQMFENMLNCGIEPDHITYVGVLMACTHVGLVADGRRYYTMMQDVHGIKPTSSHYSCMIDLFGRAGLLQEANNFIQTMPIEPDIIAWGSLLASCKVHKNLELAKVAADRLLSMDPENSGAYSALANVYSNCGKWELAASIRKLMKDRQVKKEQGFSWLQIKNEVHIFGVEDGLHPEREAIYDLIGKIWKEIRKMGFVPDTQSVLHDLDQEVKEQILQHHSEKLAIAFGLLNTPKNSTLRIMKNLRVCNDCHIAIKYISKLVNREIILRDATRFHHFKGGLCSCQDYW